MSSFYITVIEEDVIKAKQSHKYFKRTLPVFYALSRELEDEWCITSLKGWGINYIHNVIRLYNTDGTELQYKVSRRLMKIYQKMALDEDKGKPINDSIFIGRFRVTELVVPLVDDLGKLIDDII